MRLLGVSAGILLYLEIVYHLGCYGFTAGSPVFALTLIMILASMETLVVGCVRKKRKKRVFWTFTIAEYLLFAAQMVYKGIFKQPLLWEAVVRGGQDALTNYWREALVGILSALPFLTLMALPLVLTGILIRKEKLLFPSLDNLGKLRAMFSAGIGGILAVMVILIGRYIEADYYDIYSEFYDPLTVAEDMGVLTLAQRDTTLSLQKLGKKVLSAVEEAVGNKKAELAMGHGSEPGVADENSVRESENARESWLTAGSEAESAEADSPETENPESKEDEPKLPTVDTSPNRFTIDFAMLKSLSNGEETVWLAEYLESQTPTAKNEYTGIFEGHNLIFITAEGFSPYAVREDLTPTLYRLIHSGFDFNNYYVPLWQTSTSDGEYVNCTGLIPDGQYSMRNSGDNTMVYALPGYFASEGVSSMAYHNNSLTYYDRHITHNNLGYVFKAARLGGLSQAEWGEYIFPMENPDTWPASDLEMVQGTLSEYVNLDRFHVYYLTVSGHMNYSFRGNSMASKNREAVEGLEMSENAKAYIACQMELDKALQYLLEQLEAAGKLENTVICLSADHYPYGMSQEQYEELAGKPLGENRDMYRNNLIIWNVKLEENPQVIDKVCCSVDILPTLLNLFGFDFDSRLYAGRDIFSGEEGVVIFNDRSFITDKIIYDRKTKETVWKNPEEWDAPSKEAYLEDRKQEVKDRYNFSAYILRNDYYNMIQQAVPEEQRNSTPNPAKNQSIS
ncbi:MAG: LTA synthase family protein [Lachnospiraceae bacterium]|nr:LTA synthase family protein [Lachnospiraceae bacterium]